MEFGNEQLDPLLISQGNLPKKENSGGGKKKRHSSIERFHEGGQDKVIRLGHDDDIRLGHDNDAQTYKCDKCDYTSVSTEVAKHAKREAKISVAIIVNIQLIGGYNY